MKFNKNHAIWKTAPWHVKLSVIWVPSLKALYLYAYGCFFVGLFCFLAGTFLLGALGPELSELIYSGTALGLASCLYLFAIVWVKDNPECMEN